MAVVRVTRYLPSARIASVRAVRPRKTADNMDLHKIPQWFIGITGLIYLTGFLVVTTHLSRFGIRDAGGEFLRLKFIQVGLLYFLPYLVFVVPLIALAVIRIHRNSYERIKKIKCLKTIQTIISGASILVYLGVFNFIVFFGPRHFVREESSILLILTGLIFISLGITTSFIDKWANKFKLTKDYLPLLCRAAILFALCKYCWNILAAKELNNILVELANKPGTWLFVGILVIEAFVASRFAMRIHKAPAPIKSSLLVLGSSILVSLYFLNVLAFAFTIYQYIPMYKGGGDYLETPNSTIYFRDNYNAKILKSIHPELLDDPMYSLKSQVFKIIHETQTTVYVAQGNPADWRKGINMPDVFSIRRESINSIKIDKKEQ